METTWLSKAWNESRSLATSYEGLWWARQTRTACALAVASARKAASLGLAAAEGVGALVQGDVAQADVVQRLKSARSRRMAAGVSLPTVMDKICGRSPLVGD